MFYIYLRVSTTTQARDGYGLETQEEKTKAYADEKGIRIEQVFCDAGISGTEPDRPGLAALLAVLKRNDKVIVLNTSRLWRSDTAKVLIRHELKKVGADVISVEQPTYSIYTGEPNDFLINGLFELLDAYDRMQITRKLAAGRKTRASKGNKACGAAPYGYMWENKRIKINKAEADILLDLRQAFKKYGSYQRLEEYAARKGYVNRSGRPFTRQSLRYMLNNDFYSGVVTHAGQKYKGTHAAII